MTDENRPKVLEMTGIGKAFAGTVALDNVDFDLFEGECHALVGENGAGKSTLIKILCGAYSSDSGTILLDGKPVTIRDPHHAQQLGISAVHQEFQLIPYLSGLENIFIGRLRRNRLGTVAWKELRADAEEILRFLEWDADLMRPVREMSVAERQLIQIARAISLNVRTLILDEPTAMLGDREVERLFRVISILKSRGVGIIYISHRLGEVFRVCDRFTVLRDGKVVATDWVKNATEAQLIGLMLGRSLGESFPERNVNLGPVVLEVRDLSAGERFSGVSFELHQGEILGIAGLVGAGKTELAQAIFGNLPHDRGAVLVAGKDARIDSPSVAIARKLAFIPDDRRNLGLIMGKPIRVNASMVILKTFRRLFFIDRGREKATVGKIIRELDVRHTSLEQKVDYLSGGNQQKVVLAKWLIADSDIFIFDEPTKGIDVGAKREFYRIISDLAKAGKAVILISPELDELMGLTHRLIVMANGRVVATLTTANTSRDEVMRYAIGGAAHANSH